MKLSAVLLSGVLLAGCGALEVRAKERARTSSGAATSQLYQLLDESFDGKLVDFCVLADVYKDPKHPQNELQHVLRADYNRKLFFGRFVVVVRSIDKPTPAQLKTYSPKQMFDFGEVDLEKFEKIRPGPFGSEGDLYLHAEDGGPLITAPITDEALTEYDTDITEYLLPALKKK